MPHGKVCYLEMPAKDIEASKRFYTTIFGWKARMRGDGSNAFDDGIDNVSGTWMKDLKPSADNGIIISIMVDDIDDTLKRVKAGGGRVVLPRQELGGGAAYARFLDPAGNLLSLYQEGR